jgi:hypothetical protein
VWKTTEVVGGARPTTRRRERRPRDPTTPATTPVMEAATPVTSASARTDTVTWRRLPPKARRSASSLERWTTRTEKVLKMKKPPTRSPTAARTRSVVVRKPSALVHDSLAAFAACSAVSASTSPARAAATRARSVSGSTPRAAPTEMAERRPS